MNKQRTESNRESLTERQLKIIPFFAGSLSYLEACAKAGMNRTTFYEWLKNPAFKAELKRARDQIIEEALSMLKGAAVESVQKLVHLMRNSPSELIQRGAANDLLMHLAKFREHEEIETRLIRIEERLDKKSSKHAKERIIDCEASVEQNDK